MAASGRFLPVKDLIQTSALADLETLLEESPNFFVSMISH